MDTRRNSDLFRELALEQGFSHFGFARAERLDAEGRNLERWLAGGMHGDMSWMERNFDKRVDPRLLEPGTRSVIVLLQNYYPGELPGSESGFRVSKYALGDDYHKVLRKKMKAMILRARNAIGDFQARAFVDSAPVMERAWARRAGLAWQGRNTLSIVKRGGSFFFIGIILTDLELEYDEPLTSDYCGSCSLCIDACPTGAISRQGVLDARRCISYLTIESKGEIPEQYRGLMQGWVFGCDICQDVCPHNKRYSIAHHEARFNPRDFLFSMSREEWLAMEEVDFERLFQGSPVRRAGYAGWMRNLKMED